MVVARLKERGALEPHDDLYKRGQNVKQFLQYFSETAQIDKSEKIAVVCHSALIASLNAKGVTGSGQ